MFAILFAAGGALAGCASAPEATRAAVGTAIDERGLGADAGDMIANIISHRAGPGPKGVVDAVRGYLADPLSTLEAAEHLDAIPAVDASDEDTAAWAPPDDVPAPLKPILVDYVSRLGVVQRMLRAALPADCCDPAAALAELVTAVRQAPALSAVVDAVDRDQLRRAVEVFYGANRRLLVQLAELDRDDLGEVDARAFSSPIGLVRLGSSGDDDHRLAAALLIDPGGNDRYHRPPAPPGGISVVIDLAGDDLHEESDVALFGITVVIDLAGDDRYRSDGPGQAAALGGFSFLYDAAGDDDYNAGVFAQAAAAVGYATLVDVAGDDQYWLPSRGQGFAGPLGFALLHDLAGNDGYFAESGLNDPFNRSGGGLSYAQGVGAGFRSALAGGIGALRDDAGNDSYYAEKFAQGEGYFYGLGILRDDTGADAYTATRYAQGQGAHAGVGLLDDRAGDDDYKLDVGVGQGMGLDVGIGVLIDRDGDDRYSAPNFGQGSTTGNGFGLLGDGRGNDIYYLAKPGLGWGRGRGSRGLPGLPFLIDVGERANHLFAGELLLELARPGLGGPLAGLDAALPPPAQFQCPSLPAEAVAEDRVLAPVALLNRSAPLFGTGSDEVAAYSALYHGLPDLLPDLLHGLPVGDINLASNLRTLLRCFVDGADAEARARLREMLMQALAAGTPHALLAVTFLRRLPPPPEDAVTLAETLQSHADCGVRAGALLLAKSAVGGEAVGRDRLTGLADKGLADDCWQAKASALSLLNAVQGSDRPVLPQALWDGLPSLLKPRATVADETAGDGE